MAAVAAAACPPGSLGNSRTALMLLSHEYREIHRSASLRQDGSSSRGRKTKHNTATRRWIDTVGLPDLAAGKLPSAQDLAMLRSGPRGSLSGAALAARDAWSQQHARDPRSKQLTASKQLKWRYTAFNAAGQSAIVIDTESCSRYDAALVAAHRAQRRAAHCWEHGIPCIATCDNPAKDGRGCVRVIVSACTQARWCRSRAVSTNVDSVSGAQVDPFPRRITEGTPFVLFGFCNVLVRARRMCLDALACVNTVGLARRYELHALSSAGESGGDSPRLLVTGWLCYRPITGTTDYSLGLAALADATADAADAVRWRR